MVKTFDDIVAMSPNIMAAQRVLKLGLVVLLDMEKTYKITELNWKQGHKSFFGDGIAFTGDYLMKVGITLNLNGSMIALCYSFRSNKRKTFIIKF